jgi:hypothetical protein
VPSALAADRAALSRMPLFGNCFVRAVGEEGVPTREIAEAIGRGLDVPVTSIAAQDAQKHFGWIGGFFAMDIPASSARTQELLGWTPSGPTLLQDLDAGSYFRA